ncbi:polymorphic toxin-type HINT domain-containing protein [Tundrisphaera lichenicola]|uniref:polymorphic toxin-type HINT domain-containing protein n=1 Tax=Tundrisphaera lichenicola TaxID=2029860 RepID=UPI003EBBB847
MMIALACVCSALILGDVPHDDIREAGLRGLVYDQGRWITPDELIGRDRGDSRHRALRKAYETRRSAAPETEESQRELARWCDSVGLEDEAVAHFTVLTRIVPDDPDARQRLGHVRRGGRWMSAAEVTAEATEAEAQAQADREWGPKIAIWRRWLNDPEHRAEATRELLAIRDPRAIPTLRRAFADRAAWEQSWAIKVLARLDSPLSSQVLAHLAVFGLDDSVRIAALRSLGRRDPRTFVGLLINWFQEPIRYEVVRGTGRRVSGILRVEGPSVIVERTYQTSQTAQFGGRAGTNDADARDAVNARQRTDIRALERSNVAIELTNARVERALEVVTGVDLGPNPESWTGWWIDELGYSYRSPEPVRKPIVSENIRVVVPRPPVAPAGHSCFGAGTLVLTRSGSVPIEQLKVGDQVLSQDPITGEIRFRPVLATFHNRPSPTLRVELESETIVATPIHRFWRAGQGWTMARDLLPGDLIRSVGGVAEVVKVGRDQIQPVFNLEVEGGHSFFVGTTRALVHDNSLVIPSFEPFDAGVTVAKAPVR